MGTQTGDLQPMHAVRHVLHRAVAALITVALLLAVLAAPASAHETDDAQQSSQDAAPIPVNGRGWGHGRGMGQYGAVGYAIDLGWSSEQILDHYYGDTVAGTVPNSLITVRIEAASDQPTVAAVDSGAMVLLGADGKVSHIGTGRAIRLTSTNDGFVIADAPTCAGPFVDRSGVVDLDTVRISTATTQRSAPTVRQGAGRVVTGDWDGDGDDDIAVVAGSTWKLWFSGPDSPGHAPDRTLDFAGGATKLFGGDWNGDGIDTPGSWTDGTWTLLNGQTTGSGTSAISFGTAADTAIVGDWNGDGTTNIGLKNGSTWSLSTSVGQNPAEIVFQYGAATDKPIVGDWDGDGTSDPGLIRGTSWLRRTGLAASSGDLVTISFSNAGQAVVGDWDGDGISSPARRSNQMVDRTGPLTGFSPRLNPNLGLGRTIQRCVSPTEQRFYRGELRAVANNGNQRTVNAVQIESYLRAVVPLEMPASWANLANGAGEEALQVQAVGARSYARAENRTSYAETCDTISCQVYGGRAVRRGNTITSNEHPLSDKALVDTAGRVRKRGGVVARTEFSSSTGGWTAGGVFPAVEDLGDAVSINPNHDWELELTVANVEARWSNRRLDRILVTERNGLGEEGGRVEEVTLWFGAEVFTISGNDFRRAFGLKSDWFSIDWKRNSLRLDCLCPTEWPDHGLDDQFAKP